MKKAVVLVVVIGVAIIISMLAFVSIHIMTNEARIAEHKIRRMRATFAAQGAIVNALERLRREGTSAATLTSINTTDACISGTQVNLTVHGVAGAAPSDYKIDARVTYPAPSC